MKHSRQATTSQEFGDDEKPQALQGGDILLAPPPAIPLVGRNDPLWKTAIPADADAVAARQEARQEGQASHVMYFAQPPDEVAAVGATTTTIVSGNTWRTAAALTPAMIASPAIPVPLATATSTNTTTTATRATTTQHLNGTAAAAAISHEISQGQHQPATALPDHVPSTDDTDMKMVEEVSSSMEPDMSMSNPAAKKRKKQEQQMLELPSDACNRLTQKVRHDELWQVATTKHAEAKSLIKECKDSWLAHQQQQQHAANGQDVEAGAGGAAAGLPVVLSAYVLPAVPARVAPPTTTTAATWESAEMQQLAEMQQIADYLVALSERNKEFEQYIAAMDQWMGGTAGALQDWTARAEEHRQDEQSIAALTAQLAQSQQTIAAETARSVVLQQANAAAIEKGAASTQEQKSSVEALLACFSATAATE